MDRLIAIAYRYSRYGVWFGGGLIILSAFIVAAEVLIRASQLGRQAAPSEDALAAG